MRSITRTAVAASAALLLGAGAGSVLPRRFC